MTHPVTSDTPNQFDFGSNWERYAQTITPEKIDKAVLCLKELLGTETLAGLSFLDIGCGSGIHSLAALRLGADYVMGIDNNAHSVKTTQKVLESYAPHSKWQIEQSNILTDQPAAQFDVVYSWGVLHHTGAMDKAIRNACGCVKPGGKFIIALYKKTPLCGFWRVEKRLFNYLPKILRFIPTGLYAALYLTGLLARGRNPLHYVRHYKNARGMNFWHDAVDWLGGYPYESASPQEVEDMMEAQGFKLVKSANTRPSAAFGIFGSGCAEYVFIKAE